MYFTHSWDEIVCWLVLYKLDTSQGYLGRGTPVEKMLPLGILGRPIGHFLISDQCGRAQLTPPQVSLVVVFNHSKETLTKPVRNM